MGAMIPCKHGQYAKHRTQRVTSEGVEWGCLGGRLQSVDDLNHEAACVEWIASNGGNWDGLAPRFQASMRRRMKAALTAALEEQDV